MRLSLLPFLPLSLAIICARGQQSITAPGLGPGITATTASPSVLSQLAQQIEAYDHSTVGKIAAVGTIISEVVAEASAFPTAASALQAFRSELNYHPTDFIVDVLMHPSAYLSDIAAVMPTNTPFPEVVVLVSSIINEGEVLASKILGYDNAASVINTSDGGYSRAIPTTMQTSPLGSSSGSSSAPSPSPSNAAPAGSAVSAHYICGVVAAAGGVVVVAML